VPSWSVHTAVASDIFGISREVADEVNRIIDKEDFHDLGRRMPGEPRLVDWILRREEAGRKIARRAEAIRRMSGLLSRGGEWTEAFWLHHALDFLAPRITAAYIVNVDPERYEANLLEGVKAEMWPLQRKDPVLFRSLNAFLETFRSRFSEVLRHPGLRGWARATADRIESFWHGLSISEYLKPYMQRVLKRMANEQKKGEAKEEEGESVFMFSFEKSRREPTVVMRGMDETTAMSLAYKSSFDESAVAAVMSTVMKKAREDFRSSLVYETNFMQFMYRVSKFAAHRSHLIYYTWLLPFPREIISERLLRVTKRRAAGLGREALRICRDFTDDEERRQRIIREVHDFERIWLSRRGVFERICTSHPGISLPERCIQNYADSFIKGYETVKRHFPPQ